MVLLNDVFEVAATAKDNGPPPRIFLPQETQRDMAPAVTVEESEVSATRHEELTRREYRAHRFSNSGT